MFLRMALGGLILATCLLADEGIWLFDQFPAAQIQKKYGVAVSGPFLKQLQLSSVRFNNGGSGSFVSPNGLLFTNHHVGADCIQKVSTQAHDYMADGFYAASQAEEKACPDLEVNVLLATEDVTPQVTAGIPKDASNADANRLRRASIAGIEKACSAPPDRRCDVVPLYSGAQYSLYRYKKYTDVRLVFAPEDAIAAFGGDPDNFNYPRYDLDFSLFRAYENGQPAHVAEYLKWSREGVKDGELTFVPGHPGSTGRLQTVAQMEFSRDVSYPLILELEKKLIAELLAFSSKSAENKRVALDYLNFAQNSYKALDGFERGLRDPKLMDEKREQERKLRAAIADDPQKQKSFGAIWNQIAGAEKAYAEFYRPYYVFEVEVNSVELLARSREVLRYSEEKRKPNDQRLRGYQDAALPAVEQRLFSAAPIDNAVEELVLAQYLDALRKYAGSDDAAVKQILNGQTPREAARRFVSTSKMQQVEERKRLAGNAEAVEKSNDGMLQLARLLDPPARKYRKQFEDRVEATLAASASKIAQARFAVYGSNEYPDATFTLRMSYGPVKGYTAADGKPVPYATTFAGLYQRATGKEPYKLPASWLAAKPRLNLDTPFNFVTTADTHGGNSGSPTIDAKAEVIGILFDGNLEGLPNRYVYTEDRARSVHVAGNAIVEALRVVYRADRILSELGLDPASPPATH